MSRRPITCYKQVKAAQLSVQHELPQEVFKFIVSSMVVNKKAKLAIKK